MQGDELIHQYLTLSHEGSFDDLRDFRFASNINLTAAARLGGQSRERNTLLQRRRKRSAGNDALTVLSGNHLAMAQHAFVAQDETRQFFRMAPALRFKRRTPNEITLRRIPGYGPANIGSQRRGGCQRSR